MPAKYDLLIEVRWFDGAFHRKCSICGRWKPFSMFYKRGYAAGKRADRYQRNRPRAQCKRCEKSGGPKSWVPLDPTLRPFVRECVERIGVVEIGRRTGISRHAISQYCDPGKERITRGNATKLLWLLRSLREHDERHTRNEIHRNEALRKENQRIRMLS